METAKSFLFPNEVAAHLYQYRSVVWLWWALRLTDTLKGGCNWRQYENGKGGSGTRHAPYKNLLRQMNSELAVVPGGLTKELQPLDIGVHRAFKVRLRTAWSNGWQMAYPVLLRLGGSAGRVTPKFVNGMLMLGLTCLSALLFELSQKPASFTRSLTATRLTVTKIL